MEEERIGKRKEQVIQANYNEFSDGKNQQVLTGKLNSSLIAAIVGGTNLCVARNPL